MDGPPSAGVCAEGNGSDRNNRFLAADMEDVVTIRKIRPEDEPAVTELHRRHYWRSNCLLLNRNFYRWQLLLPPESAAAGGDQSVVAVDKRGQLLSFLAVAPASAVFRARPMKGAHLISWLSPPEARGRGIGSAVISSVIDQYDFVFGRSPRPASLSIFKRLGFRCLVSCRRWLAVLDPEAAVRLAVDANGASAKRAAARKIDIRGAAEGRIDRTVPPAAASLATEVLTDSTAFERTHDYLGWRYEMHPFFDYRFLSINGSREPTGFAVVRIEDVSGRSGRVLRIIEFIAAPQNSLSLANAVLSYGSEQQCAYADMFGVSERFVSGFLAAGGFDAAEEPELRLPHLLQPWDPSIEMPDLIFYARRDDRLAGGIGPADDMSLVHVSKGDTNLDWPSWVPTADGNSFAPKVERA